MKRCTVIHFFYLPPCATSAPKNELIMIKLILIIWVVSKLNQTGTKVQQSAVIERSVDL